MTRIRLLVEDITKKTAHDLCAFMQKRISFEEIDIGTDWFVGFIEFLDCHEDTCKKVIDNLCLEWLNESGYTAHYSVEDMDNEGCICCSDWNNCVCEGCKFAYDGKDPCRIGCTEA